MAMVQGKKIVLRKCPRCDVGIEPDAVICESCGAVLRQIASADDVIESVICGACGATNAPENEACSACSVPLWQTCPRCQSTLRRTDHICSKCGLERAHFVTESYKAARRKAHARHRHYQAGRIVCLLVVAFWLLLAIWNHFEGRMLERNAAIVMAMLFVVFWIAVKFIR
jgi:predicted amidophosphoribosyltransferase